MTIADWDAWGEEMLDPADEPHTVEVEHDGEQLVYRRVGQLWYLGGDTARVALTWADLARLGVPVPLRRERAA